MMITSSRVLAALSALALATAIGGCRGETSEQPPIHIVPNMDWQQKLKAQSESHFPGWTDGRGMRLPVHGTIARGQLGAFDPDPEVARLEIYKNADGSYVTVNPLPRTAAVLARGRERFAINCAVCHGLNARGLGMVGRRLGTHPPNLVQKATDDDPLTRQDQARVMKHTDGELFDVISNGRSTMQPYRFQVTPADRWAIVHYIRALQYRASH